MSLNSAPWVSHPVISTFLWLIGKDQRSDLEQSSSANSLNKNVIPIEGGRLSWKDRDGGDLATIYRGGKGKKRVSLGDSTKDRIKDSSNSKQEVSVDSSDDIVAQGSGITDEEGKDVDGVDKDRDSIDSASPQWGFYVSLSPTVGEVFPKGGDDK
jgi:hypothetical protein